MSTKEDALSTCGSCTAHEHEKKSVPYIVHEGDMARMERSNKRLTIICVIMFFAFFVTNGLWLYRESQFEDVVTTVTQDLDSGDGGNAIVNDGVHINGESEADSND